MSSLQQSECRGKPIRRAKKHKDRIPRLFCPCLPVAIQRRQWVSSELCSPGSCGMHSACLTVLVHMFAFVERHDGSGGEPGSCRLSSLTHVPCDRSLSFLRLPRVHFHDPPRLKPRVELGHCRERTQRSDSGFMDFSRSSTDFGYSNREHENEQEKCRSAKIPGGWKMTSRSSQPSSPPQSAPVRSPVPVLIHRGNLAPLVSGSRTACRGRPKLVAAQLITPGHGAGWSGFVGLLRRQLPENF